MNRIALGIGAVLLLISGLTGCVSTSGSTSNNSTKSPLAQQEAMKDLDTAWRLYRQKQYHEAIPNLLHLISRYPNTPASIESRYLLGLCYYKIEGYQDALILLNDYLKSAPEGKYATESMQLVDTIKITYESRFPSSTKLSAEIDALETELAKTPQSVTLRIQLADKYWMNGSYDEAARVYLEIAKADPAYTRDQTFNERIELRSDGSYTIITPDEQTKRAIDREPLVIVNTNSFHSGRDILTSTRKYYVVSGQVVNRSQETMYGVEVYTTIYGFGNVVWDTNQYNVGRMYPGETRAFSFRFENFRNIEDINHYDCKVNYQR